MHVRSFTGADAQCTTAAIDAKCDTKDFFLSSCSADAYDKFKACVLTVDG